MQNLVLTAIRWTQPTKDAALALALEWVGSGADVFGRGEGIEVLGPSLEVVELQPDEVPTSSRPWVAVIEAQHSGRWNTLDQFRVSAQIALLVADNDRRLLAAAHGLDDVDVTWCS